MVVVTARTRAGPVRCPGCGQQSSWEHSRYVRRLGDEAIGGRAVRIDLSVRRLYCENTACSKVTFVEQVCGLTVRYQRRTPALQLVVEAVAVALAGSVSAYAMCSARYSPRCSASVAGSGLIHPTGAPIRRAAAPTH
ncbi:MULTISPECIES: transposase family protein [unclassified Streptomyces]|uniref:transposase family protein n=1 Tax=unclassified Streptomyces TaxID=2593676 RepID=UPI001EF97AED|nr:MULTISPECIES: transposase family protein [unclassified Streptomyces]